MNDFVVCQKQYQEKFIHKFCCLEVPEVFSLVLRYLGISSSVRSSSFLLALSSGRRENIGEMQDDSQESSVRSASGLCGSY